MKSDGIGQSLNIGKELVRNLLCRLFSVYFMAQSVPVPDRHGALFIRATFFWFQDKKHLPFPAFYAILSLYLCE